MRFSFSSCFSKHKCFKRPEELFHAIDFQDAPRLQFVVLWSRIGLVSGFVDLAFSFDLLDAAVRAEIGPSLGGSSEYPGKTILIKATLTVPVLKIFPVYSKSRVPAVGHMVAKTGDSGRRWRSIWGTDESALTATHKREENPGVRMIARCQ